MNHCDICKSVDNNKTKHFHIAYSPRFFWKRQCGTITFSPARHYENECMAREGVPIWYCGYVYDIKTAMEIGMIVLSKDQANKMTDMEIEIAFGYDSSRFVSSKGPPSFNIINTPDNTIIERCKSICP